MVAAVDSVAAVAAASAHSLDLHYDSPVCDAINEHRHQLTVANYIGPASRDYLVDHEDSRKLRKDS